MKAITISVLASLFVVSGALADGNTTGMQIVYPTQGSSNIRDHAPGYFTPPRNKDGSKQISSSRTYGSLYGPGPGAPNGGNATYGSFVHVTGQHE